MKRFLVILGFLFVAGLAVAGFLYVTFPVQMSTYGAMGLNFLKSFAAPPGTLTTEANSAYKAPGAAVPSPPLAEAAWPGAAASDWPSYNRTPTSQRFSPLDQINTKNVGNLKIQCVYEVGQITAFESGLIMVINALIGSTQFDIFSIDPATCAENWRTHLDYPAGLLPSNRGPAYMDGLLFRGTQDCRVVAFDFKTGKQVWETPICDSKRGESVPWNNAPGIPISGGGTWTSYTLDIKNGLLYVPGGQPAPDFASGAREGENLFTDSVVVLDAKTGDFRNNFKVVKKDWHDWDVSAPPILLQTMAGKQLMSVAPKDGHLYGYDLAASQLLYRVPITTIENAEGDFAVDQKVHFCPGPVGGNEWSTPGFDPMTNLIISGTVDWCDTVTIKTDERLRKVAVGQPWTGMATLNPINMFGKEDRTDGHWAGWIYASDADTGVWKWRAKSNYPFVAGITPTAGGIVFVGDVGGNFYALDSSTGQKLWGGPLGTGGGIGGGVITYTVEGVQKVAVADNFTMAAWPIKPRRARIVVLGLDNASPAK